MDQGGLRGYAPRRPAPAEPLALALDVIAGFLIIASRDVGGLLALLGVSLGLYASTGLLVRALAPVATRQPRPRLLLAGGGVLLFALAVHSAYTVSPLSGVVALWAGGFGVLYYLGGDQTTFGPTLRGVSRGATLLLGMSVSGVWLDGLLLPAAIVALYVTALTLVGGERPARARRHGLYAGAVAAIGATAATLLVSMHAPRHAALLFGAVFFAWMLHVGAAWYRNLHAPAWAYLMLHRGALGAVVLNAALAAAFAGALAGTAVLLLVPCAHYAGKLADAVRGFGARRLVLNRG